MSNEFSNKPFMSKLKSLFTRKRSRARKLADEIDLILKPSGLDYILVVVDKDSGDGTTIVNASVRQMAEAIDGIFTHHPEVLFALSKAKMNEMGKHMDRIDKKYRNNLED